MLLANEQLDAIRYEYLVGNIGRELGRVASWSKEKPWLVSVPFAAV